MLHCLAALKPESLSLGHHPCLCLLNAEFDWESGYKRSIPSHAWLSDILAMKSPSNFRHQGLLFWYSILNEYIYTLLRTAHHLQHIPCKTCGVSSEWRWVDVSDKPKQWMQLHKYAMQQSSRHRHCSSMTKRLLETRKQGHCVWGLADLPQRVAVGVLGAKNIGWAQLREWIWQRPAIKWCGRNPADKSVIERT